MPEILLRKPEMLKLVPLSYTAIYRRMQKGTFPLPIKLGGGQSVAWKLSELQAWIEKCERGGV